MRIAIACLMLISTTALAAPAVEQYDPVLFEKRFHKADVDKNDRLSRQEAYSEFPRMPEFFDEIDSNKDKAITLLEVQQALERRVDAAFEATKRYDSHAAGKGEIVVKDTATGQERGLPSEMEAKRAYRQQYYESLSEEKARARDMGEPIPKSPTSPLLDKRY